MTEKKRTTLPAPGFRAYQEKKVVIPPAPRPVMPPMTEEKPRRATSTEAEKLKKKLGYNRDPEENNTGISYSAFITGIYDAKKLSGIKSSRTGKDMMVFLLETEYGKYVLSKKPLTELRDLHAAFLDLDCETNRRMKVPIYEIKNRKEYLYLEKMEEKLELNIDVDYSKVGPELNENILRCMNLPEIEELIKKAEKKRNTQVNMEIVDIEVVEDQLLFRDPVYYLAVKTDTGDEYWIYIKEDKTENMKFNTPEMEMIEVETGDRVYGITTFFSREPINTGEIDIN
jgi:hypothetical protein